MEISIVFLFVLKHLFSGGGGVTTLLQILEYM